MIFDDFRVFGPPPWKMTVSENGKMVQIFDPPHQKSGFFRSTGPFFWPFFDKTDPFFVGSDWPVLQVLWPSMEIMKNDHPDIMVFDDHPWHVPWPSSGSSKNDHPDHDIHDHVPWPWSETMIRTMTMIGSDVPTMESDHPCHKTMMVRIDIFMTHHQILAGPPKMTSGPLHF